MASLPHADELTRILSSARTSCIVMVGRTRHCMVIIRLGGASDRDSFGCYEVDVHHIRPCISALQLVFATCLHGLCLGQMNYGREPWIVDPISHSHSLANGPLRQGAMAKVGRAVAQAKLETICIQQLAARVYSLAHCLSLKQGAQAVDCQPILIRLSC